MNKSNQDVDKLKEVFYEVFSLNPDKDVPLISFMPVSLNIMGNHLDYNGGQLLPISSNVGLYSLFCSSSDDRIEVYFLERSERHYYDIYHINDNKKVDYSWHYYIWSILRLWIANNKKLLGMKILFSSKIPLDEGFGLSMAMRVLLVRALHIYVNGDILWLGLAQRREQLELIDMCQRSQQEFEKEESFLYDLYSMVFSRCSGQIIYTNSITLESNVIDAQLPKHKLWAVYVGGLVSSLQCLYRMRLDETRQALFFFQAFGLPIKHLSDLTHSHLKIYQGAIDDTLYRKVSYVIQENLRVPMIVQALMTGDIDASISLLRESAKSLEEDYHITSPLIEQFYDHFYQHSAVKAVRLSSTTGGVFLLLTEDVDDIPLFLDGVTQKYRDTSHNNFMNYYALT